MRTYCSLQTTDSPQKRSQLHRYNRKQRATRIVLPASAAGTQQQITVSISGSDRKYASAGIHLAYDSRLVAEQDPSGEGTAVRGTDVLPNLTSRDDPSFTDEWKGVFFTAFDYADNGRDGDIASVTVTIPENAWPGDVYPIDIVYRETDRFTGYYSTSEESRLMEAYFFTQGIFNEEYNNSFKAASGDIAKVPALADIDASCDGYVAVRKAPVIVTTTAKTTTTTSTTAETTTETTTVTTAVPVIIPDGKFRDGINNWSFSNSSRYLNYIPDDMDHAIYYITEDDLRRLEAGLSYSEIYDIEYEFMREWGGSCQGMSALAVLSCHGIIYPSLRDESATTLYNSSAPPEYGNHSAITYYYLLQFTDYYHYWKWDAALLSEQLKTSRLLEEVEAEHPFR